MASMDHEVSSFDLLLPTAGNTGRQAPLEQPVRQAAPSSGLRLLKRRTLLWGIASSVMSALGLVAFCLFEVYTSALNDIRNDLKHFNETSADYVKKEAVLRYKDQMKQLSKDVAATSVARANLEQELRASERVREDLTKELQRFRERLSYVEGLTVGKAGVSTTPPGAAPR